MALTVEDGSIVAGAESYASVATATAYHAARGNVEWAALASDTVREQCLRKATDYMTQAYRWRWAGFRKTPTQSLDWPREAVYLAAESLNVEAMSVWGAYPPGLPYLVSNSVVPIEVRNGCAELALRVSAAPLIKDEVLTRIKKEKVGPLEMEYFEGGSTVVRYTAIDLVLSKYFKASNTNRTTRG